MNWLKLLIVKALLAIIGREDNSMRAGSARIVSNGEFYLWVIICGRQVIISERMFDHVDDCERSLSAYCKTVGGVFVEDGEP